MNTIIRRSVQQQMSHSSFDGTTKNGNREWKKKCTLYENSDNYVITQTLWDRVRIREDWWTEQCTFPNNTFHTVLWINDKIPSSRVSRLFPWIVNYYQHDCLNRIKFRKHIYNKFGEHLELFIEIIADECFLSNLTFFFNNSRYFGLLSAAPHYPRNVQNLHYKNVNHIRTDHYFKTRLILAC
jgi:hypothetical protein